MSLGHDIPAMKTKQADRWSDTGFNLMQPFPKLWAYDNGDKLNNSLVTH